MCYGYDFMKIEYVMPQFLIMHITPEQRAKSEKIMTQVSRK